MRLLHFMCRRLPVRRETELAARRDRERPLRDTARTNTTCAATLLLNPSPERVGAEREAELRGCYARH